MALLLTAPAPPGQDPLASFMDFRGVILNATRLEEVARKIGPTEIRSNELDAAAATHAMCYVGPDSTFLGFASNDEMGGGLVTELVLSSTVRPLGLWTWGDVGAGFRDQMMARAKTPICSHLGWLSLGTKLGGLHLGISEKDLRRRLGSPQTEKDSVLTYETSPPDGTPTPNGDKFFRYRSLRIVVQAGKVVSFTVSETITD